MSVSRGKFLKSLGKSLPGMVLGGGLGTAAEKLLARVAAASGAPLEPAPTASPAASATNEPIDFLKEGPVAGNRIALTFDDGPTLGVTDRILDVLKQRGLQATFFMIGNRIAASPELARRVLAEGHEVGNHTFNHAKLTQLDVAAAEREIAQTQAVMAEVLDHRAVWFRPPYGALRPNQAGIVRAAGLRPVLWSVDSRDWAQPGEAEIIQRVLLGTKSGSIILCHDLHSQTATALPQFVDDLLKRGFTFVSVSSLCLV